MNSSQWSRRLMLTAGLWLVAAGALAQTPAAPPATFEPRVGQPGKDVVWVPTPQLLVDTMLDMAKLTPSDYLIDLGSGDGRTVITAAKRGARAQGIEYNPDMVKLSQENAIKEGVTAKASFAKADIFESDFSQATVISMFLLPSINLQLRPKILDLKPGTRIVSNTFTMGDWIADGTTTIGGDCVSWCTALLWIVPAKVAGTWRLPQGDLTLEQEFQMLTGTLGSGPAAARISEAKMLGTEISFTAGGVRYTGRLNGAAMEGTTSGAGAAGTWRATRAGA